MGEKGENERKDEREGERELLDLSTENSKTFITHTIRTQFNFSTYEKW